jgi:hypothetical protein
MMWSYSSRSRDPQSTHRPPSGKQYSKPAAVYDELGSAPLAADARLLAAGQSLVERRIDESRQQLDAVVAFADKAGATLYRQHAERLRH